MVVGRKFGRQFFMDIITTSNFTVKSREDDRWQVDKSPDQLYQSLFFLICKTINIHTYIYNQIQLKILSRTINQFSHTRWSHLKFFNFLLEVCLELFFLITICSCLNLEILQAFSSSNICHLVMYKKIKQIRQDT